nr:MAG TPA: hypothetical protein [Caudoviricetes sp.]
MFCLHLLSYHYVDVVSTYFSIFSFLYKKCPLFL